MICSRPVFGGWPSCGSFMMVLVSHIAGRAPRSPYPFSSGRGAKLCFLAIGTINSKEKRSWYVYKSLLVPVLREGF